MYTYIPVVKPKCCPVTWPSHAPVRATVRGTCRYRGALELFSQRRRIPEPSPERIPNSFLECIPDLYMSVNTNLQKHNLYINSKIKNMFRNFKHVESFLFFEPLETCFLIIISVN